MPFFYALFIHFYAFFIKIASFFSEKAKLWHSGRKNVFPFLEEKCAGKENIIWFHCASLGEFEQGRPLMELLKEKQPSVKILLTFFSPSGYEIRKHYEGADYVFYLPADTPRHAKQFLNAVNPKSIFFVKYEFWYNYIHQAHKRNIPFYSVSCRFKADMFYFSWYGKWFCRQLAKISHFFTQDEYSAQLLYNEGITQATVCGDTRFDRVHQVVKKSKEMPFFADYCKNNFTIVAGSTWQPDEKILADLMSSYSMRLIIAPHQIHEEHIHYIEKLFSDFSPIRYSQILKNNLEQIDNKVVIIDSIGLLSSLYRYGDIAYVGGGFGAGIHNILEAAAYGKPIVFGHNHKKFNEAADLIRLQAAFAGKNSADIQKIVASLYADEFFRNEAGKQSLQYAEKNIGAAERVYELIMNRL